QAGAQVVRILHTVEYQHQRAPFGGLHQPRELVLAPGARRSIARHRALVAQAAGNAVQRLLRDPAHLDAQAPRIALDLDDARIPRPRLEQHLAHVVPVMLDGRSHRIDPRDPLTVLAHPALLAPERSILTQITRIKADNRGSGWNCQSRLATPCLDPPLSALIRVISV